MSGSQILPVILEFPATGITLKKWSHPHCPYRIRLQKQIWAKRRLTNLKILSNHIDK
jgi:hypothetical protein